MFTISVEDHFDSAHRLVDYDGPCATMHGHRWIIKATWVAGHCDAVTGIVIDFKRLKSYLRELTSHWDHKVLNDFLKQPTAENLARHAFTTLRGWTAENTGIVLQSVQIMESPGCTVEYSEGA